MMVMLGSHSLEVSSTSNQKCVESFEAPHHSIRYIENQFVLQFLHTPSVSHDPIA